MTRRRARDSSASYLQNINCLATDHSLPRCWVVGNKILRLMPDDVSSTITKIFKDDIHREGVNWKAVPVDHKKKYFLKFKDHFSWAPAVGPAVLTAFMKKAAVRYRDMISKFKNAPGNQKPGCVSVEVWQEWLAFWSRPEVIAKSKTARQNRLTEKAGPGTGCSRHSGGSRSAYAHSIALQKKIGRAPNALECSLHIHKRRDGTFVDPRASIITAAVEEREREVRAAGGTVDVTQIYVEVVGVDKQRLFGSAKPTATITMFEPKITSKPLIPPLIILLLLLSPFIFTTVSLPQNEETEDFEDIDELIAIDDEQEKSHHTTNLETKDFGKKSEAEILSKAQRVVIELNNDNTKRVIEENEYVMVLGYAPWCARSAELMPRFAEAANVLKGILGSGILMAKIDAERYPKAAKSLGIKGFPTLLLFVNGTSQSYTGGFSSEEMVIWARKKMGSPVIRINSVAEANEFLKQHTKYAIGLFDKFEGLDYGEFIKAAAVDNEIQFVETSITEVTKALYPVGEPEKPFFGLVKSEPEHYTSLDGDLRSDRILHFLENNKFPLVTIMTELNSAKVYSSTNKLQVFVFAESDDLKKLIEPLQEIAKKFNSEIMFVGVDIAEDNLAKPFLTLFGLEESEETIVVAFNYNYNSKYLLETGSTSRNIEDFCAGLVKGTLNPYYKSQPIPNNNNASVLTVVGKTFDELVLSGSTNILLEVHTPWCINCETTSKHVEKLAKHFKGLDSLVFARIDASTNEHPKLQVEDYPTLLFYPASDKSNPIKLPTKSSLKDLAALINKNLKTHDSLAKDEL